MMKILITGGCGFVGSSIAIQLKEKYPSYHITTLDNLKRRGSEININLLKDRGIYFCHGDIRIKNDLQQIGDTDLVIDASAEPSVLSGIVDSPGYTIETNLNGTINCIEYTRQNNAKFIFLSTSRIYPIEKIDSIEYHESSTRFEIRENQTLSGVSTRGVNEDFPLNGVRSFYGASKYASELMINEYMEFLGFNSVINRCGVITGPGQFGKIDQGFLVLWVARHYWSKELKYIGYGGKGKQVRDVLHIKDLFELIDFQIHNFEKVRNQTFNVGGGPQCSISLRELTDICVQITGNKIEIGKEDQDRKADIRIYITDNSKISKLTGWQPESKIEDIVEDVYSWIKRNESQLYNILIKWM